MTRLFYMGGTLALVWYERVNARRRKLTIESPDRYAMCVVGFFLVLSYTLASQSGLTLNSTSEGEGRYAFLQLPERGSWTLTDKEAGFLPAVIDNLLW